MMESKQRQRAGRSDQRDGRFFAETRKHFAAVSGAKD